MSLIDVATILPWALVACGCGLGYTLVRQSSRMVERLETMEETLDGMQDEIEEMIPKPDTGLPPGEQAPAFELPDLHGRRVSLEDYRGRRILLVFFSPTCPFCQAMAPDLAALPSDGAGGRPLPVVITSGDPEANRALIAEHGIRCPVLLDEAKEVMEEYESGGTPAAYVIDEQGLIAKERADGAPAVIALGNTPKAAAVTHASAGEQAPAHAHAAPVAVGAAAPGHEATHEVRLPVPGIPQGGIGVGDLIRRMTDVLHIKPCRGCERRRQALNRWVIKGPRGTSGKGREGGS